MTPQTRRPSFGARFYGLGLGVAVALTGLLRVTDARADCSLTEPLTIADTQDGFAGQVGTVWTITADCSFSIARQIGSKVGEPERQGRFTAEQRKAFTELFAEARIADLPSELGNGPTVNARRVTLTYGDKTAVLILPPGDMDLGMLATTLTDDPSKRVAVFADGVQTLIDD
jgi:hypothetical protein